MILQIELPLSKKLVELMSRTFNIKNKARLTTSLRQFF